MVCEVAKSKNENSKKTNFKSKKSMKNSTKNGSTTTEGTGTPTGIKKLIRPNKKKLYFPLQNGMMRVLQLSKKKSEGEKIVTAYKEVKSLITDYSTKYKVKFGSRKTANINNAYFWKSATPFILRFITSKFLFKEKKLLTVLFASLLDLYVFTKYAAKSNFEVNKLLMLLNIKIPGCDLDVLLHCNKFKNTSILSMRSIIPILRNVTTRHRQQTLNINNFVKVILISKIVQEAKTKAANSNCKGSKAVSAIYLQLNNSLSIPAKLDEWAKKNNFTGLLNSNSIEEIVLKADLDSMLKVLYPKKKKTAQVTNGKLENGSQTLNKKKKKKLRVRIQKRNRVQALNSETEKKLEEINTMEEGKEKMIKQLEEEHLQKLEDIVGLEGSFKLNFETKFLKRPSTEQNNNASKKIKLTEEEKDCDSDSDLEILEVHNSDESGVNKSGMSDSDKDEASGDEEDLESCDQNQSMFTDEEEDDGQITEVTKPKKEKKALQKSNKKQKNTSKSLTEDDTSQKNSVSQDSDSSISISELSNKSKKSPKTKHSVAKVVEQESSIEENLKSPQIKSFKSPKKLKEMKKQTIIYETSDDDSKKDSVSVVDGDKKSESNSEKTDEIVVDDVSSYCVEVIKTPQSKSKDLDTFNNDESATKDDVSSIKETSESTLEELPTIGSSHDESSSSKLNLVMDPLSDDDSSVKELPMDKEPIKSPKKKSLTKSKNSPRKLTLSNGLDCELLDSEDVSLATEADQNVIEIDLSDCPSEKIEEVDSAKDVSENSENVVDLEKEIEDVLTPAVKTTQDKEILTEQMGEELEVLSTSSSEHEIIITKMEILVKSKSPSKKLRLPVEKIQSPLKKVSEDVLPIPEKVSNDVLVGELLITSPGASDVEEVFEEATNVQKSKSDSGKKRKRNSDSWTKSPQKIVQEEQIEAVVKLQKSPLKSVKKIQQKGSPAKSVEKQSSSKSPSRKSVEKTSALKLSLKRSASKSAERSSASKSLLKIESLKSSEKKSAEHLSPSKLLVMAASKSLFNSPKSDISKSPKTVGNVTDKISPEKSPLPSPILSSGKKRKLTSEGKEAPSNATETSSRDTSPALSTISETSSTTTRRSTRKSIRGAALTSPDVSASPFRRSSRMSSTLLTKPAEEVTPRKTRKTVATIAEARVATPVAPSPVRRSTRRTSISSTIEEENVAQTTPAKSTRRSISSIIKEEERSASIASPARRSRRSSISSVIEEEKPVSSPVRRGRRTSISTIVEEDSAPSTPGKAAKSVIATISEEASVDAVEMPSSPAVKRTRRTSTSSAAPATPTRRSRRISGLGSQK